MDINPVDRTGWRPATDVLAAAFHDDPVFGWLLPDDTTRAAALRRFFAIETRHVVLWHGLSMAGTGGVALVLPSGQWRIPLTVQAVQGPRYLWVFGRRLPHAMGMITALERHHPRADHYYLPYIGVAPAAQGHGLGTALLRPILDRCDRDGVPAYLEASNPRCARLYERLGFTTTATIRPLGAPPIQLMWREPGANG